MEKKIKEKLDLLRGQVVKIRIKKNNEIPFINGDFIAMIEFDEKLNNYVLDYPYDLIGKNTISEQSNFDNEDTISIDISSYDDFIKWYSECCGFITSLYKEKKAAKKMDFFDILRDREKYLRTNNHTCMCKNKCCENN